MSDGSHRACFTGVGLRRIRCRSLQCIEIGWALRMQGLARMMTVLSFVPRYVVVTNALLVCGGTGALIVSIVVVAARDE